MTTRAKTILRYALGILLGFAALNAFAGGYYALAGAEGVPTEWLNGSPFQNYFIPGLILFIIVGGIFLTAAIAVFAQLRIARRTTFSAVLILFIWLGVQIAIIGYVSWMQPTTAIVAVVILLIASLLPEDKSRRMAYTDSNKN